MAEIPETRVSLILRLTQPADVQAWQEFADIYTPALLTLARRKGLQPADAEDLTQEILFGVARSVQRFKPDPSRARFRTWLWRIARNLIADFAAGRRRHPLTGPATDSWLEGLCLSSLEAPAEDPEDEQLAAEVKASIFRLAARRVRRRVAEATWQAFQTTSLDGVSAAEAAQQLGMPLGSVYVARCRVMQMLKTEAQALSQADDGSGIDFPTHADEAAHPSSPAIKPADAPDREVQP